MVSFGGQKTNGQSTTRDKDVCQSPRNGRQDDNDDDEETERKEGINTEMGTRQGP